MDGMGNVPLHTRDPLAQTDPQAAPSSQRRRYAVLALLPLVGIVPVFAGEPAAITLTYAAIWACYAIGYDLFSGFGGRVNLGYAMFPGVGAYTSAILNVHAGWSPWLSVLGGACAAVLLALIIGVLTLRIQGIYFALSTSIVPLALYQLTHILGGFLGGEEGIWGVEPFFFDPRADLWLALGILGAALAFALWFSGSKAGLVLRAIKGSELTAQALGLHTFRYLLITFLISAIIGAVAGAFLAHSQMFVGPEILHIITTLQVIMFTQVGGPGTIIGPVVGSFILINLNETLRAWTDLRLFVYFVALVLIMRFSPDGLLAPLARWAARLVRRGAGHRAGKAVGS